ncbi:hypothetical protein IAU60_004836 [Kwoniella sp. DSM 27419]
MIVGIGIDILQLARFKTLLVRRGPDKLAKRICTPREYEAFSQLRPSVHPDLPVQEQSERAPVQLDSGGSSKDDHLLEKQLRFLSCRWALKEAAYKALSAHLKDINWSHLDITHSPAGAPILYPTQLEHRTKFGLLGSLTHDAGVVVAVVIAQENTER